MADIPQWLEPGVTPPSSLRNSGWQPLDKPPAQYMNWFFNRTYLALQEFQEYMNSSPGFSGDYNDLTNKPVVTQFITSAIEPTNQNVGDVWFDLERSTIYGGANLLTAVIADDPPPIQTTELWIEKE